jgi:hypothetical protein
MPEPLDTENRKAFSTPEELAQACLSSEAKIEMLRQWEYDARLAEVATDENMPDGGEDLLARILAALHSLGYRPDGSSSAPTKEGGES